MDCKTGKELLQEKLPITKKPVKFMLIGFLQLGFFSLLLLILYKITILDWRYSIIGEIIASFFAILPYAYVTINSKKIRLKYREKYKDLAFQHVWFRFLSYNEPISAASLFFPILLKTDYFLPKIINLPLNQFTKSIMPIYIVIPLGIFLLIFGMLIRRPTGGYDSDIGSYMYLIFPENSRKLNGGLYNYLRHPNYAGRGVVALGIGILANNILAIILAIIHFTWFYILSKVEDRELVKRFGESFKSFKKDVPAIIPKIRNFKPFLKMVFLGDKKNN